MLAGREEVADGIAKARSVGGGGGETEGGRLGHHSRDRLIMDHCVMNGPFSGHASQWWRGDVPIAFYLILSKQIQE